MMFMKWCMNEKCDLNYDLKCLIDCCCWDLNYANIE